MSTMRNSVMLIGIPTQPIMDTDKSEATFNLSVTESCKNERNEWVRETYSFNCIGERNMAQRITQQVKKGNLIAVEGRLRNHDYKDLSGHTHTRTEVAVSDLFIIEKKQEDE